jgi:hypothetical protein
VLSINQNNVATVEGVGVVFITATIAETEFTQSRSIYQRVQINKANPTITIHIPDFHILPNEDNDYSISIISPDHYESSSDGLVSFFFGLANQNVSVAGNVISISEPIGNITILGFLNLSESTYYSAISFVEIVSFSITSDTSMITTNLKQLAGIYASVGTSFPLTYTSTGDGTFTIDNDTPEIVSVLNQVVSFDHTGFATLTIRQNNGATYFGNSETVSFIVNDLNLIEPTFIFSMSDVDKIQPYSENKPIALNATTNSDGELFYLSSDSSVLLIQGTDAIIKGVGKAIVTAVLKGSSTYNGALLTQTFLIQKAVPNFTFPVSEEDRMQLYVYGINVNLNASSTNSDGLISYLPYQNYYSAVYITVDITGTHYAYVAGIGSTMITATIEPTDYYLGRSISVLYTVYDVAPPTVPSFTFDVPSLDLVQPFLLNKPITLNAFSIDSSGTIVYFSDNEEVLVIQESTALIKGIGTATVTARLYEENYGINPASVEEVPNDTPITTFSAPIQYSGAIATQTFVIERATPDFTFLVADAVQTQPFDLDHTFTLTATSTNSNGVITFSSSNRRVIVVADNTATVKGVGTSVLTATLEATELYEERSISVTVTIYDDTPPITPTFSSNWTIPNKQTNDTPFSIIGLLTSTNTVTPITYASSNLNVATVFESTITIVGAGTTTITASQASNANYNSPTPVTTTFTVTDPTTPVSVICFVAGTPVHTDQGIVQIETINPERHTIRNKRIVGVTKTWSPNAWLVEFDPHALGENKPSTRTVISMCHKVEYQGVMTAAYRLINNITIKKVPYHRETLYNVLQDEHGTMIVNNIVCETLHPDNITAKLFRLLNALPWEEKVKHVSNFNAFCETHKIYAC